MRTFIGLDLDNTYACFTSGLRDYVAERAGFTSDEAMTLMPALQQYHAPNEWNLEETPFTSFLDAFKQAEQDGLYSSLSPLPYAAEALSGLVEAGYAVIAVTARPQEFRAETAAWVREFAPEVRFVVHSANKPRLSAVTGGLIDIFIDDAPTQIQGFVDSGATVIAYSQDYNADVEGISGRLDDWRDALPVFASALNKSSQRASALR